MMNSISLFLCRNVSGVLAVRPNSEQTHKSDEALEPTGFVKFSSRKRHVQTPPILSRPYVRRPSVVSNINIGR